MAENKKELNIQWEKPAEKDVIFGCNAVPGTS